MRYNNEYEYRGNFKKVVTQDRRDLRSRICGRVYRDLRGFGDAH